MYDVIVVGGGPVGSRTACQLADRGYHIAVLEKKEDIGRKPCCTGIISQECIERYSIPPEVIYRKVNSAKLFSPASECIRLYRPQPQAGIVDRAAFDRLWAARARAKSVEYFFNRQAEKVSICSDRAVVDIRYQGQPGRMEARAVVLANGFNSLLAKQGGLGSPDYFTTGVQAEVESGQLDEVEVYFGQRRAPGFFAWLVPTSKGKALAGLMSRETPGLYLRKWLCELQAQGRINAGVYPIRYSGIPLKYLNRTSLDRTLVVGDAAGQVKSTTGGGLYFGLICADIAAETLHNALMADNLTAQMLSQYDRLWKQKLEPELKKEYFARKAYEHLADNQINWLFRFLESSDIVEPLLNDESILFDWHGGLLLKVLRQCALSPARKILKFGRI